MESYIRGRMNISCCDMIDELRSVGIKAAVGHSVRGAKAILTVVPHGKYDASKVPSSFRDMPVVIEHQSFKNRSTGSTLTTRQDRFPKT